MGRSIALSPLERREVNRRSLESGRTLDAPLLPAEEYAVRSLESIHYGNRKHDKLALIIPAYNEEEVLAHTVQSAINAGQPKEHIYIVDDCSSDATSSIARRLVGKFNILTVERSGKSRAIFKLHTGLRLTKRYEWIHIADADGEFDENYFTELFANLDPVNAAATGYVASLPGGIISTYRAFEYTIGMDFIRRFQSMAGVITIIPGPTSIFRSDVFEKLEFAPDVLCEDFDVTLQLHRRGLGTIQYIPTAVARTQDPSTLQDFVKQVTRWNRGIMQMLVKHRIGSKASKVDTYLLYQIMQNFSFFLMYFAWVPVMASITHNTGYFALAFVTDALLTLGFVTFASMRTHRSDILTAFPFVYALRFVSLGIFLKSFFEVIVLRKFITSNGTWTTVKRRSNA